MMHVPSPNFLVVAHPRTGTNFLCHLIANGSNLRYLGEFYPNQKDGPYNIIHHLFHGYSHMDVRWQYDLPDHGNFKGRFAKLFYHLFVSTKDDDTYDIRWDLLEYVKRIHMPVIHLKRKNVLDTAISSILADNEKNFVFSPYKGPVEVPAEAMARHLRWAKMQERGMDLALRSRAVRNLEVWYDDLVTNPQATLDRVCDFLHRPRTEAVIGRLTRKQRQGGQRDNIVNYDELKAHFAGGKFATYFED
jgi:LPS sulfotransferase NodH